GGALPDPSGVVRLRGDRPAGGEPGQDHGGGLGPDEPGDAADVGALRDLLQPGALPRLDAVVRAGAAPDAAHPGAAGGEARRGDPGLAVAGGGRPGRLRGRHLRAGAAVVPLDLTPPARRSRAAVASLVRRASGAPPARAASTRRASGVPTCSSASTARRARSA